MSAFFRKLWNRLGAKGAAALAALLLLVVILFQNLDTVTIDVLFWDAVSLAKPVFILLCVALGLGAGLWLGWRLWGRRGTP